MDKIQDKPSKYYHRGLDASIPLVDVTKPWLGYDWGALDRRPGMTARQIADDEQGRGDGSPTAMTNRKRFNLGDGRAWRRAHKGCL